ncbi:hypothetical protein PF004_g24155 [Phytophthora fragariae]|uniref:Uncharacterized protein n=1 Tax=Phytophthora fragariae TaxID=53985 RepID=A0A6G0MVS4_9STRA|nr:hypothetical protein PF004_g24155 [Phytophthora fragariae]
MDRMEADIKKLLPIFERLKDGAEEEGRWNAAGVAQQQNETAKLQEGYPQAQKNNDRQQQVVKQKRQGPSQMDNLTASIRLRM